MRAVSSAIASSLGLVLVVSYHASGQVTHNRKPPRQKALLLLKTRDNPFFAEIERGVRDGLAVAQDAPELDVRAGQQEGDVSTQRQILDDYLSRLAPESGPRRLAAVFLTPAASGPEFAGILKRFRERKVPVILIDTKIRPEALTNVGAHYSFFVGSSNRQGGALVGALFREILPKGGRLLLLNGVDGHETAAERRTGFLESLSPAGTSASAYAITERTCNWRRQEARATTDGLLSLGKRFEGIFAANDEMALGALEAIRQHPEVETSIIVVGFDATDEAKAAIARGTLYATVAQDPYAMGKKAVTAARGLWNGATAEDRDEVVPVSLVRGKAH